MTATQCRVRVFGNLRKLKSFNSCEKKHKIHIKPSAKDIALKIIDYALEDHNITATEWLDLYIYICEWPENAKN